MHQWLGTHSLRGTLALVAMLACVSLLSVVGFSTAQAGAIGCRTDPIVTLSNGDVLTILVDVNAAASAVKRIDYTLHVPKGVTITKIVYTGSSLGLVENLTLRQDAKKEYQSETVVSVAKSVGVAATLTLGKVSVSDTGKGGKTLKAKIKINKFQ